MKLTEFVKCPVKVQRCAGRVVQTELVVQVDQKDVVPGDIVIFEPGDLFPGDIRLLSSKHLVVRYLIIPNIKKSAVHSFGCVSLLTTEVASDPCCSQSSLTGESGTTEKMADIKENESTPLLDLRNICFMVRTSPGKRVLELQNPMQ